MKKFQKVTKIAAVIMAIAFVIGIFYVAGLPRRVKDEDTIKWCEASDDMLHADIKSDLEKFVENKYDVEVDKIAFKMQISSYAYQEYQLETWYRTADGVWYTKTFDDVWGLPTEIGDKLVEQVMFG